MKPLQKLSNLKKIDASHNIIESLEGFCSTNNRVQSIILFHNNLKDSEELLIFKDFNQIVEIVFERNGKSNPFCDHKKEYLKYLREALTASRFSLKTVDDIDSKDIEKIFVEKESVIE